MLGLKSNLWRRTMKVDPITEVKRIGIKLSDSAPTRRKPCERSGRAPHDQTAQTTTLLGRSESFFAPILQDPAFRLGSAYICLNGAFSYSSLRIRLISEASMPPNWRFHGKAITDAAFASNVLGGPTRSCLFQVLDGLPV